MAEIINSIDDFMGRKVIVGDMVLYHDIFGLSMGKVKTIFQSTRRTRLNSLVAEIIPWNSNCIDDGSVVGPENFMAVDERLATEYILQF